MKTSTKYWIAALSWVALIYSTLYIIVPISVFLQEHTPFEFVTSALVIGVLIIAGINVERRFALRRLSTYVLLSIVLGCYIYGLIVLKYPAEKMHFIQYGLLSYLLFRALDQCKNWQRYALAFLLTAVFGAIDEYIQHLLPNRYGQWPDVWLNVVSGFLGLCMIFTIKREITSR